MERAIVTSALPYANGEIHLGHVASTYLPADVTVRFLRQRGAEAYHVCASDDFGTPILVQAEKEGKSPAEYVAHWNRRDREDFESLGVSFDAFSGTSSERNVRFVQDVYLKLKKAGHIYEKSVVRPYCEKDRKFLPDRYVRGTCPSCGAADQYSDLCESCGAVPEKILEPRCAICGAVPVRRETVHKFFRLSDFSGRLREWLEGSSRLQDDVKRYVTGWIEKGLEDWDITRDISWGVPVPGSGGVFYGWFDNHLAYISTAEGMLEAKGVDGREFWNSARIYHFIGKDIAYHHYLLMPAVRMGVGEYKLPDMIPTRGHLTLEGRKISKSRGWYIGLRQFLSEYRPDYLRYYLLAIGPYSQDDLNFDWGDFATRVNSELIGNLGNLVNRALGFASRRFGGVPEPGPFGDADREAREAAKGLPRAVGDLLEAGHTDRALRRLMDFSSSVNGYFQHSEPWKGGPGSATCAYVAANSVRSLAVCASPFIPHSARAIWGQLGLEGGAEAPWESAGEFPLEPGHELGRVEPVFEPVGPRP